MNCIPIQHVYQITYNNTQSLLNGLKKLINLIKNNELSLEIARIKNVFKYIQKWKSYQNAEYCDINLDVVCQSPFSTNKQCFLVELQFLLHSVLKAKKMGHKFYNISGRNDLIKNVNDINSKTYNTYPNYKHKIIEMINDANIDQFSKPLILKPNVDGADCVAPLLRLIAIKYNAKMIESFLDCLFYYNISM